MRFAFRSLAVLFAAVLGTSAALAQPYPAKQPIKAVVPFAAGSATDQIGRAFAAEDAGNAGTDHRRRQQARRQRHAGRRRRGQVAAPTATPS